MSSSSRRNDLVHTDLERNREKFTIQKSKEEKARFQQQYGPEARNHAEAIAQILGQNTVGPSRCSSSTSTAMSVIMMEKDTRNSNNPNVHLFNYEEHNNDILDVVSTPQERQEARDRRFGAAGRMASSSSTDHLVHTDVAENLEKFNRSKINDQDLNNNMAENLEILKKQMPSAIKSSVSSSSTWTDSQCPGTVRTARTPTTRTSSPHP
ncbi:unnamed protein product [Bursaphelenchus xylophilus]|uniref:(pine wood nematode) hypothetical protein n=1 Tax=Bursaphelenchus xylophilus TaxID=6326 RepID=A0A1I7SVL7_BURXY|nr:unnamed protein product [Bursaphelenchus xylophilus]CAG9101633.1 unnamed protein product [Bursaphelenchus xylophilus]